MTLNRTSIDGTMRDVLDYMNDKSARYAIALEGDWGSGKTRFCKERMSKRLYAKGFTMLRVSLFGASKASDLYSSIALAFLKNGTEPSEESLRGGLGKSMKEFARVLIRAGVQFGAKQLEEQGVFLEVTPQILTSTLGDRYLIVFDDMERSSFTKPKEFYGVANNLVEEQGCKVMFVTNDYSALDADLREKLIWRCLRFSPSPEELVDDILGECTDGIDSDFDLRAYLLVGAKSSECRNARAMIKARRLVQMVLSSSALLDRQYDADNRGTVLSECVKYTLLAASGKAPTKPVSMDWHRDGISLKWAKEESVFEDYMRLGFIGAYFDPKVSCTVTQDEVDRLLHEYLDVKYPASADTMRLVRLLDQYKDIVTMTDQEAKDYANRLFDVFNNSSFDLSYLYKVVSCCHALHEIGVSDASTDERLLRRAGILIERDPLESYKKYHLPFKGWAAFHGEASIPSVLKDIDERVMDAYSKNLKESVYSSIDPNSSNGGTKLANAIAEETITYNDMRALLDIEVIVGCFANGSPKSKSDLINAVQGLQRNDLMNAWPQINTWANELINELKSLHFDGNLDMHRRDLLVDAVEQLAMDSRYP